jgi:hypothetical protein
LLTAVIANFSSSRSLNTFVTAPFQPLNPYPLDPVEARLITSAIIKLRGARAGVVRHLLGEEFKEAIEGAHTGRRKKGGGVSRRDRRKFVHAVTISASSLRVTN